MTPRAPFSSFVPMTPQALPILPMTPQALPMPTTPPVPPAEPAYQPMWNMPPGRADDGTDSDTISSLGEEELDMSGLSGMTANDQDEHVRYRITRGQQRAAAAAHVLSRQRALLLASVCRRAAGVQSVCVMRTRPVVVSSVPFITPPSQYITPPHNI